jgi:predicted metal-dependent peptidase
MNRSEVKDKKAFDAVIRARTSLLVSQPFFGCLSLQLEVEERADLDWWQQRGGTDNPTMAVDGFCMYYSPKFVLEQTEQELTGVIAHEVFHCAYKHMTRRGTRHPVIWNWAGDYVINDDLLTAGFTLPKERLHDPKYKGMSTEDVYERIKQDMMKKSCHGDGTSEADGQDRDKGGCGSVLDATNPSDKDGAEAKNAQCQRDWEAHIRMAVQLAKQQNAGTVPGYLERLVTQLKAPKVSWRDMTRQFIDGNMHKDFSFARPNRRSAALSPMILPGLVPDALHKLVVFMDVSGSVSEELMRAMAGEVEGALNEGVADVLVLAYIDTEIRKVDEYLPGDMVEAKCVGGGGTDFRPAFKWLNKEHVDASCVIYLTDMQPNSWDLPETTCPVMWAAYCSENMLASINVPYGHVIHVDGADF